MTPLTISDPHRVTVTLEMGEIHALSLDLLHFFEDNSVKVSAASAALALTFARVLSPEVLEQAEEVEFLHAMFDFIGAYFGEGGVN